MTPHTPDMLPVLSRGKHRSPRRGACFMELASYLAGERWSDEPACTHPVLAALARDVNDSVRDRSRGQLAPLIPQVIGLTTEDPRAPAWIAREAALTALPIVSLERQGVAAMALMRCEAFLNRLEGHDEHHQTDRVRAALAAEPWATDWALRYARLGRWKDSSFTRRGAPAIVHMTVAGISVACVDDPDEVLIDLLARVIDNCRTWFDVPEADEVDELTWRELCALGRG